MRGGEKSSVLSALGILMRDSPALSLKEYESHARTPGSLLILLVRSRSPFPETRAESSSWCHSLKVVFEVSSRPERDFIKSQIETDAHGDFSSRRTAG